MPSYVVTGASRGLGVEFVRQLSADSNNTVFGIIRNPETAEQLLKLDSERSNVHVVLADVSKLAEIKKAAEQVGKVTGGTLDYLINNAALMRTDRGQYTIYEYAAKGEDELLEKDLDATFKANVVGVIHTTNAFIPLLRAASKQHIARVITLSTGFGDVDCTLALKAGNAVAYSVSKAAVNLVVAKYAVEFRDEPFVFLSISPGFVNTLTETPTPGQLEQLSAFVKGAQAVYPGWSGQPLTPEQSVKQILPIIDRWERKDSGASVSHYGNKTWL